MNLLFHLVALTVHATRWLSREEEMGEADFLEELNIVRFFLVISIPLKRREKKKILCNFRVKSRGGPEIGFCLKIGYGFVWCT